MQIAEVCFLLKFLFQTLSPSYFSEKMKVVKTLLLTMSVLLETPEQQGHAKGNLLQRNYVSSLISAHQLPGFVLLQFGPGTCCLFGAPLPPWLMAPMCSPQGVIWKSVPVHTFPGYRNSAVLSLLFSIPLEKGRIILNKVLKIHILEHPSGFVQCET